MCIIYDQPHGTKFQQEGVHNNRLCIWTLLSNVLWWLRILAAVKAKQTLSHRSQIIQCCTSISACLCNLVAMKHFTTASENDLRWAQTVKTAKNLTINHQNTTPKKRLSFIKTLYWKKKPSWCCPGVKTGASCKMQLMSYMFIYRNQQVPSVGKKIEI